MPDFEFLSPLTPQGDQPRAIEQLVAAYREGRLKDEPVAYNVTWMKQHHLGGAK